MLDVGHPICSNNDIYFRHIFPNTRFWYSASLPAQQWNANQGENVPMIAIKVAIKSSNKPKITSGTSGRAERVGLIPQRQCLGWSQWSVGWPLLATRSRSIPDQSHSVTRNEPHMVTRWYLLLSKWGLSLTRLASGPRIMVAYNWRGRGQELKLIAKLAPPTKNCPQWPKYWPWWPKNYLWSPKPTSFLGSFFLIWGNPLHLSNKCPLN